LANFLKCSAEFKNVESYQFDLVNLTRQFISPLGYYWILELEEAYQQKDLNKFLRLKKRYLELIMDFDRLLSTRKEYLLGKWLEDAKRWGESDQEKKLYEANARNLITLWCEKCTEGQFDDLNNYAYKQWAGMFSDYHLVRWDKFFEDVEKSIQKHEIWDRTPYLEASCKWELNCSKSTKSFALVPTGDPVEVSREIIQKYRPFLIKKGK
jgi:alpha-N-acetylglucosaminidase